jgi:curved DNA-binding protein CbpA
MTDHFALLGQPRRPWLEEAALKDAFHRATVQQHPDVAGGSGAAAAAVNAAYAVLRDPATRLRHLLELEWPESAAAPAAIAPELAELFGKIAALQQAGAALKKKAASAQSPLSHALLAGEKAGYRRDLETALATLAGAEASASEQLRAFDVVWDQGDHATRDELAAVQQRFAFLAKWQAQLREALFQWGD